MSIIEFRRPRRSSAPRAAIVGAALALEMAFPVILDEAEPNRLGRAVAALLETDAILAPQCLPEAA
jgi:hypothetical protein